MGKPGKRLRVGIAKLMRDCLGKILGFELILRRLRPLD
jgi:hypothetical protein